MFVLESDRMFTKDVPVYKTAPALQKPHPSTKQHIPQKFPYSFSDSHLLSTLATVSAFSPEAGAFFPSEELAL